MANDESALREVDQELAEERQWAMFRKYGPLAIGAGAALVIGVGGWQFWQARQDSVAKEQAVALKDAVELLADDGPAGRQALETIAEEETSGYSVLARFHRAASYAKDGEREAALRVFVEIYQDGATPRRLKELARLRAGYLALQDGRDAVLTHLGDMPDSGDPLSFHAKELSALAALEAKDYETALSTFRALSIDLNAPASVRRRAEEFAALAASGKAGVKLTGDIEVDDLLKALGSGSELPEGVAVLEGDAADAAEEGASEEASDDGDGAAVTEPAEAAAEEENGNE